MGSGIIVEWYSVPFGFYYTIETRTDLGDWTTLRTCTCTKFEHQIPDTENHSYSYRITAWDDSRTQKSLPSKTLTVNPELRETFWFANIWYRPETYVNEAYGFKINPPYDGYSYDQKFWSYKENIQYDDPVRQ